MKRNGVRSGVAMRFEIMGLRVRNLSHAQVREVLFWSYLAISFYKLIKAHFQMNTRKDVMI